MGAKAQRSMKLLSIDRHAIVVYYGSVDCGIMTSRKHILVESIKTTSIGKC